MPDAVIKMNSPILNKNLPVTSNDPDVVFKLFVDRLIGPNKKTTYGKFMFIVKYQKLFPVNI